MPTTSNFGWTTPADTDLVKDGAAAIRTLGNGIDTSLVDLKGGTTGQVLSKNSNTDLDYTWVTPNVGDITEVQAGTGISVASGTGPIPVVTNTVATAYDAKGDLIVGTGADTFAKLTVGTNGHTLVADSSTATGLKYQAAMGSYTSFTPVWTNLTVGNGTVTGLYREDVETVECLVDLTFGSTTSVTGNIQFDLPVTASSRRMYQPGGFLLDNGAYFINCYTFITTTTKGEIAWINVNEGATGQNFGVTTAANATTPWTWTTNDRICAFFTYEK